LQAFGKPLPLDSLEKSNYPRGPEIPQKHYLLPEKQLTQSSPIHGGQKKSPAGERFFVESLCSSAPFRRAFAGGHKGLISRPKPAKSHKSLWDRELQWGG
jgi:hypothetical protein